MVCTLAGYATLVLSSLCDMEQPFPAASDSHIRREENPHRVSSMLKFISQNNVGSIMEKGIEEVMAAAAKVIAAWDGKKYLKESVEELRKALN